MIEEFLPHLIQKEIIPEIEGQSVSVGPVSAYLATYFTSSLSDTYVGGGLAIRAKDQDFAISKPLNIRTSHSEHFKDGTFEHFQTHLAYIAAECKTNLDKTMFQEACATARDTKLATPSARYFLLCEWLDLTPVNTATTDIDEVLILRKAKRMNSNVRKNFAGREGRKKHRAEYVEFLKKHPFQPEVFMRLIGHIRKLVTNKIPEEKDVLGHGYF